MSIIPRKILLQKSLSNRFYSCANHAVGPTKRMLFTELRTLSTAASVLNNTYNNSNTSYDSLWNPTEEHAALRSSLRTFVQKEVRIL